MANIQHSITVTANTSQAKASLQDLQNQLHSLTSVPVGIDATGLQSAKTAILELGQNLRAAMNPTTGKLDLSVFSRTLRDSNKTILDYKNALFSMGTQGQQAFLSLANAIASAEAPTNRLNQKILQFGKTLKNTINWQISSSLVHGVVGSVQKAINYAEKLNTSLNNIQIVTGKNNDSMIEFARQANKTAKQLSTTTTEYTNAALIYYQQGLSDKEVAARNAATVKMANVTRQSAQTVSDQMTAIWNNYATGSTELEHYADVITALGAATAASSSEIANGLSKFAAVSKTVGLSYNYATTALATIVSTTRQSEDTVGTGLRTIFSRLESLKLGETLEDGVGLTKYTTALKSAGVEVLDQYGNVKDMDKILDELGAKWQTISREQQIALAQTVGGVRQYTNLMALMNNWDKFQKNLKIAEGADGTLQTQAERYATSWEAARKRVQTSAEGIYDSLIDDQAMIKATNVFAGFLDVVNGLVDGFGGLKVIIPTVLALWANSAAKNMPQFLNDIGNNMRVLFERSQKDMTNMQGTLGDTLQRMYNTSDDPVYRAQLQKTIDTNRMNRSLAMNARNMSDADQAAYRFKIAQKELENDAKILAAQQSQQDSQAYEKIVQTATQTMGTQQQKDAIKEITQAYKTRGNLSVDAIKLPEKYKTEIESAFNEKNGIVQQAKNSWAAYKGAETKAKENEALAITTLGNARRATSNYLAAKHKDDYQRLQEINATEEALKSSKRGNQTEIKKLRKERADIETRLGQDPEYIKRLEAEAAAEKALKEAREKTVTATENVQTAEEKYVNTAIQVASDVIKQVEGPAGDQLLEKAGISRDQLLEGYGLKDQLNGKAITEQNIRNLRENGILTLQDKDIIRAANNAYLRPLYENSQQRGSLQAAQGKLDAFTQEAKELSIINQAGNVQLNQTAFKTKAEEFVSNWNNALKETGLSDKLQLTTADLLPKQEDMDAGMEQFGIALENKLQAIKAKIAAALKENEGQGDILTSLLGKMGMSSGVVEGTQDQGRTSGQHNYNANFNIPKTTNPKDDEAKQSSHLSTSLTQVASAAMTLYTAFQSASNAVQSFSEDTSNGLSRFGTVLSAVTSGLMSAGMAGNAIKGLGGGAKTGFAGALTTAGPWIGIALAVGSIVLGVIDGIQKRAEEKEKQRLQEIYDKADESYERLTQSSELNKSQENLINAYNQTAEDLRRGQATQKELEEAKKALIESLNSSTDSGYNNSNAIGAALAGNTKEVQHIIDQNRKQALEAERQYAITAQAQVSPQILNKYATEKGWWSETGLAQHGIYDKDARAITDYRYLLGYGSTLGKVEQQSIDLLKLYSDSFKKIHLDSFSNGQDLAFIGNIDNFSMQDYQDYYADLQLYKDLIETANLQEGNDLYTTIINQIKAIGPYLETYNKYSDQIKESNLEYLMLGGTLENFKSVKIGTQQNIAANEYIKDIETYDTYHQALIDLMTEGLKKDSKEYNEEVAKIDAALGILPSVTNYEKGNLQYISKGLQSIVDNQIKYQSDYTDNNKDDIKASVKQLYDKYQDAIFDWNYTIKIPTELDLNNLNAIDDPLFQAQIKAIEAKAKANKVKIAIDATAEFNLDINSSYANMAAFAKQMNTSLDINNPNGLGAWQTYSGTGSRFNSAAFFALPAEQRQALIRQTHAAALQDYYGSGGAFEQNLIEQSDLSRELSQKAQAISADYETNYADKKRATYTEQDVLAHSALLSEYFSTKDASRKAEIKNQLIANGDKEGATESAKAGKRIGEVLGSSDDNWIKGLLASKEAMNEATTAASNQAAAVAALREEQRAYSANGFRVPLIAEAEAWGLNYDEIQQYATQLRQLRPDDFKKGISEQEYSQKTAKIEQDLTDLDQLYADGSRTQKEYIEEQQQYMDSLAELDELYNADIKASEEFAMAEMRLEKGTKELTANWKAWQKTLKNTTKNTWENTQAFIATKTAIANILGLETNDITQDFIEAANAAGVLDKAATGTKEGIQELQKFAGQHLLQDIFNKDNILTDAENTLLSNFNNLFTQLQTLADGSPLEVGMSIDQTGALDALQSFITQAGLTADQANALLSAIGYKPKVTTEEFEIENFSSDEASDTYKGEVTVGGQTIPVSGSLSTVASSDGSHKISLPVIDGGNTKFKGTGGGSSSGGGGGGKKEPHKPKRYRNIENQIQNNQRKTDAASRNKDRAVGTVKLEYLEKERELREENLKLEQQYQKEIEDWLDKDRDKMMEAFAAINFTPIFDEAGEVINNDEFELAFEAIGDGSNEAWKKAEEALAQYEETLDKLNDKLEEIQELQDAIYDAALEATKLKLDLQLDVLADRFEYLDYLLTKIDDDAYQAAEAIALLGDKTAETMKKVTTYTTGLEDILSRHGFSLSDLNNLSVEDLNAAGFTQSEIDQIKEWRSELLKANQDLLEMRKTITDKLISTFEDLNEKVQRSYELFDHYNITLEHYKNITDLIAKGNSSFQSRAALEALNRSLFTNSVNQLTAAKRILDDMPKYLAEAEQQYQDALASGDRNRIVQAERYLQTIQDREQEAREQWEEAWESSLESAQSFFEFTMENIAKDYEDTMSGMFGTLDYLQQAYERHKEDAEQYLESYDSLYQLGKLSRDISRAIDDTDSIRIKQRYRDLQAEINKLQKENAELTQHDVDMLQREFDLEVARAALEDAKNAKTQVRLQRDSEGNWGYVYTADEDKVNDALDKYAEALHAFQETNHEYFSQIQDDFMDLLDVGTQITDIMSDLDITQEEALANIDDLMSTVLGDDGRLQRLLDDLKQANADEEKIRELFTEIYGEDAVNNWLTFDDTLLKDLLNVDNIEDLRNLLTEAYEAAIEAGKQAREQLATDVGQIEGAAGVSVEDFGEHVHGLVQHLDEESLAAIQSVDDLATAMNTTFTQAMQQALQWEKDYADQMTNVITKNEMFVTSIDEMLEALNGLNGIEFYTRVNSITGSAGQAKLESFDSGGYTGIWGTNGRLAVLHEKEQIFNQDDTARLFNAAQILRTLDMQAMLASQGLGKLLLPTLGHDLSQTIDQNVTITAEFPNATNHSEIEEAFTNLINKASQYANRKGI